MIKVSQQDYTLVNGKMTYPMGRVYTIIQMIKNTDMMEIGKIQKNKGKENYSTTIRRLILKVNKVYDSNIFIRSLFN